MRLTTTLTACVLLFLNVEIAASQEAPAPSDTTRAAYQIELLEQQVDLLENHTKELQSSTRWAVGGIFTLVAGSIILLAVIAGLTIFQYNRRYQQDKEAFESEIKSLVSKELERVKEDIQDSAEERQSEIKGYIDENIERDIKRLKNRLERKERRLQSEIDALKLDDKLERIRDRVDGPEFLSSSVLRDAAQALDLTHSAIFGLHRQSTILNYIRTALRKLDGKGKEIRSDPVQKLFKQLDRLEDYPEESEDIKRMIQEIRS